MSRIPVGRDLNLELRRLLFSIDDRAVRVRSLKRSAFVTIESMGDVHLRQVQFLFSVSHAPQGIPGLPTEFETQLIKFLCSIAAAKLVKSIDTD
jgi:hypothetical protein